MDAFRNYIQNNKKEFAAILTISVFALILRLISLLYAGDLSTDEIYSYYFSDKNSLYGGEFTSECDSCFYKF